MEPTLTAPTRVQDGTLKTATFTTPVITSPWQVDRERLNQKVTYQRGSHLHSDTFPVWCLALGNTMVIDLPLEGIEDYVTTNLAWLPLQHDERLLAILHEILRQSRPTTTAKESLKNLDLMSTPLMLECDSETRDRVQQYIHRTPHSGLEEMQDNEELKERSRDVDPLELLINKKHIKGKREAKQLEKERHMVRLQKIEGLKPAQVAKRLRVSVEDVYRANKRLKVNYVKAMQAGHE